MSPRRDAPHREGSPKLPPTNGPSTEASADPPMPRAPADPATHLEKMRTERLWPDGTLWPCPSCGKKAFRGRSDLHKEIPREGVIHSFRGLRGASCDKCHAQSLEPFEEIDIEGVMLAPFVADFDARVTNIGKNTVGTYWPKDVQRLAGLRKGRRIRIEVLDRDTLLLRLLPAAD